jgi:hypothetical protein
MKPVGAEDFEAVNVKHTNDCVLAMTRFVFHSNGVIDSLHNPRE